MDEQAWKVIHTVWPDLLQPYRELVPHGVALLRSEDDWTLLPHPVRRRALDLAPTPRSPDAEALAEEAAEDALRAGWTELDPVEGVRFFETEGVHLSIGLVTTPLLLGATPSLRLAFDQPWPDDAGAPVETSEMFQNLVRRLLSLDGEPQRLGKWVTMDPQDPGRSDVIRELVTLPSRESLLPKFEELGFRPPDQPGGAWISESTSKAYAIKGLVEKSADHATVIMERRRHLT
ncbi:MAG: hypothetical protein IPG45_08000 [Deltaproteobacteria bacterium]|jgi:hypothetical protein|nr:hypothetical protein [Deltaproteobacteria bacterium]